MKMIDGKIVATDTWQNHLLGAFIVFMFAATVYAAEPAKLTIVDPGELKQLRLEVEHLRRELDAMKAQLPEPLPKCESGVPIGYSNGFHPVKWVCAKPSRFTDTPSELSFLPLPLKGTNAITLEIKPSALEGVTFK